MREPCGKSYKDLDKENQNLEKKDKNVTYKDTWPEEIIHEPVPSILSPTTLMFTEKS